MMLKTEPFNNKARICVEMATSVLVCSEIVETRDAFGIGLARLTPKAAALKETENTCNKLDRTFDLIFEVIK